MHKLVNVLRIVELHPGESVERELALITVTAPPDKRAELIALGEVFGARVADIGRDALTFEIVGRPGGAGRVRGARSSARRARARTHRADRPAPAEARVHRGPGRPPLVAKGTAMAEVIKTGNVDLLTGKVAVLGYGSQGHAHALNLADSGVEVEVGLREDSSSWAAAEEAGLTVRTVPEAVRGAQLVAFLVPDGAQAAALPRRGRAEPRRAPRSSSRTASRSTTAASSRPPATT